MTGPGDKAEGAALWQRWRSLSRTEPKNAADDNALLLAAYVDGRLDAASAEAVEEWLAEHDTALDDVIAVRALAAARIDLAPDAMVARAAALVAAPDPVVVPFAAAAAQHRRWRIAAGWSGLAASVLATSLVGFSLGSSAYFDLAGQPVVAESALHELLDPPGSLFAVEEEEPRI